MSEKQWRTEGEALISGESEEVASIDDVTRVTQVTCDA